jgi:hypothetical protein
MQNMEVIRPIVLMPKQEGWTDEWPMICLGQVVWALVKESDSRDLAKAWLSSMAAMALHSSPMYTFCPAHSGILLKRPPKGKELKCVLKECNGFLCTDCGLWHLKKEDCILVKNEAILELPRGYRKCPNPGCGVVLSKTGGCNHITCHCGQHFCFYCAEQSWPDDSSVYRHMSEKHGGCFNDPPDWKSAIMQECISEAEIEEFYKKNPKARRPNG